MAQLAMQDMTVPVIMIDEDFIEPNEFLKQHGSEAA
jgi:hypothetical protein